MSAVIVFSLVAFMSIFESVFAESQNETAQNKTDYDFADPSSSFAGNFTANFSVSNVDDKLLNFGDEKLDSNISLVDRSENQDLPLPAQKLENAIEFNTQSISSKGKELKDFRPSPALETYYEYNKFPVVPAYSEPKMVQHYENINSDENFGKGAGLPLENEKSRNLNTFEPGTFGNINYSGSEKSRNGQNRNEENFNNGPPWATVQDRKNEDVPWVSRVRFPTSPSVNENPYPYISVSGTEQNINSCCQENIGHTTQYLPPTNYKYNGLLPPKAIGYLPPIESSNRPLQPINNVENEKRNFNFINNNKVGYDVPPTSNYGLAGVDNIENTNKYLSSSFSSPGLNKGFNFNEPVEVPKTYYSGSSKYPLHHKTYETSYNLMEKPFSEDHPKTYGGGIYYSPLKKILKLFATFIPIGLLISALTPTVISVTNVNDTNDMGATRYRSNDDSKKELTKHILSSLDYFDKLNENGCEYRVFCELLVSASHMPNSAQHVDNLLDNFAKQEKDYKNRAEELTKVFQAVRNHDCSSISCEFIKNPT